MPGLSDWALLPWPKWQWSSDKQQGPGPKEIGIQVGQCNGLGCFGAQGSYSDNPGETYRSESDAVRRAYIGNVTLAV